MRIEHINLVVCEIAPTLEFLKIAFPHWKIRGSGQSDWYGKPRTWLHFGGDDTYIALSDNGEGVNRDLNGHKPGLAHIGFVVDDLDGIMTRYAAKGVEPSEDMTEIPARKNVYYVDPTGIELEFVQYLSDVPHERHDYGT